MPSLAIVSIYRKKNDAKKPCIFARIFHSKMKPVQNIQRSKSCDISPSGPISTQEPKASAIQVQTFNVVYVE